MVKISIGKITGTEDQIGLLATNKTAHRRPSRFTRKGVYLLIGAILLLQGITVHKKFSYEPPLPEFPPYNTTETIELITKWYELLQDMKYLGPNAVAYPPHDGDKAINVTLARRMGLDERVIETMQQMPYVDDKMGGWMQERDVLFRDSRFVDYRRDEDMYLSRDPLGHWIIYDAKKSNDTFEEAMLDYERLFPKSAIPLSIVRGGMWGTGDALVLDTATNRIHFMSTQGDRNTDPFFMKFGLDKYPPEYKMKSNFYGPDIIYVRSAKEVLEDAIMSSALLKDEFFPGSPYLDSYTPELCPPKWYGWVKLLYQSYGWPRNEDEIRRSLFPGNGTKSEIRLGFGKAGFEQRMRGLRHGITVRYMPDWFVPVPRNETYITALEAYGVLNQEQATFARSTEEVIPFNEKGWGATFLFSKHWEVYGKGNWS